MAKGVWDKDRYTSAKATRAASGVPDFAYSTTAAKTHQVHPSLDPHRINKKPFGKLESRDSAKYPDSNALICSLDVTGSNIERAEDAQQALPKLMDLMQKYIPDLQIAFAANDDYKASHPEGAVQFSEFEVDNLIDEHLRNLWLVGDGGGNAGESYDLILYAAARKTLLDCYEKRGRKGYLFLYADEPVMPKVMKTEVMAVFDDNIQADIPIAEIIEEVQEMYHLFFIWPRGGQDRALLQYKELVGEEHVLILQHGSLICEMIASTVGMIEKGLTVDDAVRDLVAVGTSAVHARDIGAALSNMPRQATGNLARTHAAGASRL